MGAKRPTIGDVAAQAGVDRAIVSKVLNDRPGFSVRPETRARVHRVARELDYRPSLAARSLRTSRTGAIGAVIPTFTNPIWPTILDAAETEADRRGYTLLAGIADAVPDSTSRFLELARSGAVDGLLVASAINDHDIGQKPEDVPVLHVNRRSPTGRRHVVVDDTAGAHVATQHLLDLGHRAIAHLSGPMDTDSGQRRRAGFDTALAEYGLHSAGYAQARYSIHTGHQAMRELMSLPTRPTAVMCANVASAAGALAAARELDVTIPDDVSLVAVHDIDLAASLGPPLTTVRMPLIELGRRAVELLLDTPPHDTITDVLSGPIELVRRASAAPATH